MNPAPQKNPAPESEAGFILPAVERYPTKISLV